MGCFKTDYYLKGKILEACDLDLMKNHMLFYSVVVSGDGRNVWGHSILNIGGHGGHYIHVASGAHARPTVMTEQEYRTYMTAYGKKELFRNFVYVPQPEKAVLYLEKCLKDNWWWLGPTHNCATFVEEVVHAGGGILNFHLNIPCGKVKGCTN